MLFRSQNKFGNAKLWITYSPDETDRDGDDATDDGSYTASLKFGEKNWEAFVAASDDGISDDASNFSSTKVGGAWKTGPHKVSGQFEMSEKGSAETDTLFLGYQMKMGKNTLVAQIGQTRPDAGSDVDYLGLGVIHKFNKKSRVYAGYRSSDTDGGSEVTSLAVGLRVDI